MTTDKTLKQLIVEHNNDYGFCVEKVIHQIEGGISKLDSLSIIIPYYETGDKFNLTLKCLYDSIAFVKNKVSDEWNFEVVVIDDGSKKRKAADYIKGDFSHLRIIDLNYNQGRTRARNAGLNSAKYAKCLFMDSDILVAKEFLFYNLITHAFSKTKIITVGFFQFIDNDDAIRVTERELNCKDIELNDYRIKCVYGKTWIGCDNDKQFIDRKFEIIKETDYFKKWPRNGFFGPWFLTNMILGGFFMVDTVDAKKCKGFDEAFQGYGFTETSLPTKLIAGFGHYLVPITQGGCLHIDDRRLNVSRKEKDKIFWIKHNFYFNHYLELTWKQALKGYGK